MAETVDPPGAGPPGGGGPPARSPAPSVTASWDRVVLHVDMDAFFASVEVLDDPSLAGLPVIVGGSGPRGVVAACTYEARRFGVHSAMPSSVARRCCPDAVFVQGRYHRYEEESSKLHAILHRVTPLVEGIALDEAFLDVTGAGHLWGDGPSVAARIRRWVADELGLACSVGVARTKLMAKLASKAAKPSASRSGIRPGPGVVVVAPEEELTVLQPMDVRALWGVGPATGRRLTALGVRTIGDLAALPPSVLERSLGPAVGRHLAALARGEDPRPVEPEQPMKSIGHEETFALDLWDAGELRRRLLRLADAAAAQLRGSGRAARTVTVKVRFGDFTTVSRAHSLPVAVDATPAVAAVAQALLGAVELDRGVRLLGVSLSGLVEPGGGIQLALDLEGAGARPPPGSADGPVGPGEPDGAARAAAEDDPRRSLLAAADHATELQGSWAAVTGAVDAIRARYGASAVAAAAAVDAGGIRVRRRGEAQWGPSRDPVPPDPPGPDPVR